VDRSVQWVIIIAAAALTIGGFVALVLGTNSGTPVSTDEVVGAPTTAPPATTTTAAPASSTTTVRPADGAGGFPDASTTGPTGADLEVLDRYVIDEEGEVVEGVEISGQLTIRADDVTIRNARIKTDGIYGILVDEVDGVTIEDVEIVGMGATCSSGIAPFGTWVARRVDVSGCADGVKMAGGQQLLDSYVHDLRVGPTTHNDAVQVTDGADSTISGNRLIAPTQNAAIMMSSNFGPVDGWVISGNWLEGGGYTVYVRDQGFGVPTEITLADNHWVTDSWQYGPYDIDGDGVTLEDNQGF
jgi:hypothetical protein